ncbi:hypothetical protein G6011_08094 [Alternaria panax]|uniref:Heterokaryon incompatibility domain-containing protein n=1 Tax=Alternaria panax TaxID=48097 RepID=A0AAD4FK66_9PLEO|nr:hypothetical protein G6011_08094 [Alternaria panax]
MRLHADSGIPNFPLMCTLQTADILHTDFEGLGIHSIAGDVIVKYDALSYAWENNDKPEVILCNGVLFQISTSLFEALRALRDFEGRDQYLWVDAICINQADKTEVGKQVSNMFLIYWKARKVVAWIGSASECINDVRDALVATEAFDKQPSTGLLDPQTVHKGLSYIYNRPYFARLWVQQEVYAARTLKVHCGRFCFNWTGSLARIGVLPLLLTDPGSVHASQLLLDEVQAKFDNFLPCLQDEAIANVVASLLRHTKSSLKCFDYFCKTSSSENSEFIEMLLETAILGATDPKDHIFGVLGMTDTPAGSTSIQDWTVARRDGIFIPIDYNADLVSILSAVT